MLRVLFTCKRCIREKEVIGLFVPPSLMCTGCGGLCAARVDLGE